MYLQAFVKLCEHYKGFRSGLLTIHLQPGKYTAKLQYYNDSETVARWVVRESAYKRQAKNVLFFIGDGAVLPVTCNSTSTFLQNIVAGMTQAMITAARMIAHKTINGRYQSLMQMDQMEALGQ